MLKRRILSLCSLVCAIVMAVSCLGVLAPVVKAADPWENKADVSWIDPSKKLVALTFDDGPVGTAPTASSQRILNLMEKYKLHCTYFYWGEKINNSNLPEIQRANSLGCELGNHTFTHSYLTQKSAAQIKEEVQKVNDILYPISGNEVTLIRPPYGSVNNTVSNNAGAPLINWSLDSGDWNNGNYNSVMNTLSRIQDGDIVLCHQTYDFTAQAMETLIPQLLEKGFTVVSVSELMKMKGVTLTAGTTYTNQAVGRKNITNNGFENIGIAEGKIAAIGEVTASSAAAIAEAREAYDALTPAQKNIVSNYDVLTAAEEAIESAAQAAADREAAEKVDALIAAIGTVTKDKEPAIEAARTAYEALTEAQKALVGKVEVLEKAEKDLEEVKEALPFTDANGWFESAVRYVYKNNLMKGMTPTEFKPYGTLTRAELVTILYRAEGEPTVEFKGIFEDVPAGTWYSNAVEWAASNGVVQGVSEGKFAPKAHITRDQIVTILYRYEGSPAVEGDLSRFKDADKVGAYAVNPMIWAVGEGIINGVDEAQTKLAPKNSATRCQIAAIIMRYLESSK